MCLVLVCFASGSLMFPFTSDNIMPKALSSRVDKVF